jgi:MFS transporter, PAT family, beta-lactamase induction signal transducer AmpG
MRKRMKAFIALYKNPNMMTVLCLGFVSGLPLPLVLGTLSVWLAKVGISNTSIGLLSVVSVPYALKFLWSPVMDHVHAPLFFKKLGRRRGWLLLLQLLLAPAIFSLGLADPTLDIQVTALCAFIVACLSASQDIVIDAYRVEILADDQQAAGAVTSVFGYRVGMLVSGAGALALTHYLAWGEVYTVMAALIGVGILASLLAREPLVQVRELQDSQKKQPAGVWAGVGRGIVKVAWKPLILLTKNPSWAMILLFVLFYKLGDAFAGVMTNPFLVSLGFTNLQIGLIGKTFGFASVVIGGVVGSALVYRFGLFPALFIGGILQLLSNGMFILQAMIGNDITMLAATVAIENISGGIGTAAFVAYISGLCQVRYTATQYAVLSSFAALGRTVFGMFSGWWVDHVGWIEFFSISMVLGLPGLIVLWYLMRRPVLIGKTASV